jgi:ElaB/YqjD/DUF883 family membrane-anchored ribosome-binding protein
MSSNAPATSANTANAAAGKTPTVSTLRNDLQALKSDLDTLLAHAGELTDNELHEAQDRILAKFSSLRYAAKGIAVEARQQFNHGVEVTTDYVKEKPVQSIALAIGFGTLLGIIIGRK